MSGVAPEKVAGGAIDPADRLRTNPALIIPPRAGAFHEKPRKRLARPGAAALSRQSACNP
jgi:hypothetical protein